MSRIDPIAHRRAALAVRRASDAKVMNFRQCADAYIASSQVAGEIAALTERMGTPARVRRYVMEYQRGGARPAGR